MDNNNTAYNGEPQNDDPIRNPKQAAVVVRTKTFSVKNQLVQSECKGFNSPLEFYSDFSRFVFDLINEDKKVATGNVRLKDVADIITRSKFIYNKQMEMELSASDTAQQAGQQGNSNAGIDANSPAFTVTLTSGTGTKGKTPAQFLMENPSENRGKLLKQHDWLSDNITKYPNYRAANQKQMDAIKMAVDLLDKGLLTPDSAGTASSVKPFKIYSTGMRPLTRRTNMKGFCFVYEVDITWTLGENYPVTVTLTNYYAPVTRNEKGLLNVKAKEREDVLRTSMNLQASEWEYILDMIKVNKRTYEDMWSKIMYKRAHEADNEIRQRANLKPR